MLYIYSKFHLLLLQKKLQSQRGLQRAESCDLFYEVKPVKEVIIILNLEFVSCIEIMLHDAFNLQYPSVLL